MANILNKKIKEMMSSSDNQVYITCVGEDGFPNLSVRKVDIQKEESFVFTDNANSRTVKLMEKSPHVIVNILDPTNPFHGYKIKGKALFHPTEKQEQGDYVPVSIVIELKECFPY